MASTSSPFSLQNIPFGIYSVEANGPGRAATRIDDYVIDLGAISKKGAFAACSFGPEAESLFAKPRLNEFMEMGRPVWREARRAIQGFFGKHRPEEEGIHVSKAHMHLPCRIGDYTDFYASKEHATNVGVMFRGKDNALMPNWLHLPVGYHGRASSIVVSGTPVVRPKGQIKPGKDDPPVLSPTLKLDFELEMAFIIGVGNRSGQCIPADSAEEHIFGVVLLNDWSARDIQSWEYVPLGPFLGKNFATTISPWIVTLDALEPFLVDGPRQEPKPLPYLARNRADAYDIELEVELAPADGRQAATVCRSNLKYMYWSFGQMLAHHTINGCNMQAGDLCGTGTISGPQDGQYGSMLELSWNGEKPLELPGGAERAFIQDGDTVTLRAEARKGSLRVGFGECSGSVLPSN